MAQVARSIRGFSSLSDETLKCGPVSNDLSCWWDIKHEHTSLSGNISLTCNLKKKIQKGISDAP